MDLTKTNKTLKMKTIAGVSSFPTEMQDQTLSNCSVPWFCCNKDLQHLCTREVPVTSQYSREEIKSLQ